jgi:hypothetical protein
VGGELNKVNRGKAPTTVPGAVKVLKHLLTIIIMILIISGCTFPYQAGIRIPRTIPLNFAFN